jgi:hypothetical protein
MARDKTENDVLYEFYRLFKSSNDITMTFNEFKKNVKCVIDFDAVNPTNDFVKRDDTTNENFKSCFIHFEDCEYAYRLRDAINNVAGENKHIRWCLTKNVKPYWDIRICQNPIRRSELNTSQIVNKYEHLADKVCDIEEREGRRNSEVCSLIFSMEDMGVELRKLKEEMREKDTKIENMHYKIDALEREARERDARIVSVEQIANRVMGILRYLGDILCFNFVPSPQNVQENVVAAEGGQTGSPMEEQTVPPVLQPRDRYISENV